MFSFLLFVLVLVLFIKLSNLSSRIEKIESQYGLGMKNEYKTEKFVKPEAAKADSGIGGYITPENIASQKKEEIKISQKIAFKKEQKPVPQLIAEEDLGKLKNNQELEFKLGGKIFTGIGAVAVTFGIGFFLRYAFENNLITEIMRVILGVFFGLILLGVGEFTRKKFSTYSQILTGAGLGILYLSLYAAFGYYNIISQSAAFFGMIIITALGVFLAVRYDSLILAIFSQIGGFLTPEILSTGENHPHILFLYVALLDLGIFSVAWLKLWRPLVFIGFLGTSVIYAGWFTAFYTEPQLALAQAYATLFFAIFMGVLLVHHFIRKAPQDSGDLALITMNSGLYFLASYIIINNQHHELMGLFTAILSILHFAIALIVRSDNDISSRFRKFLVSIGIVLATIAIPIQFNKHWVTICWSMEALILIFLGFQMKSKLVRIFADGIFLLSFLRLIFLDSRIPVNAVPWFNDRFFSFVVCIALFTTAAAACFRKKNELEKDESFMVSLMAFLASMAFLIGGSCEIMSFFSYYWLSAFWSISFAVIFSLAFLVESFPVRIVASIVAVIALMRLLFFDADLPMGDHAYFNIRVFLFLVSALCVLFTFSFYKIFENKITETESELSISAISLYSYILAVWLASLEIIDFHSKYWLPISWSLIALLAGWISLKIKNVLLRLAVYLTFFIIFFRLLGFESNINLGSYIPFLNTRVLSFITGSSSMVILLWMLKKFDVSEMEKRVASMCLFLAVNFLLIWLVSVEFLDYFKQQFLKLPEYLKPQQRIRYNNLENVSLSISWAVYSIVLLLLGIFKKSTPSRLLSIFIFGIVIFKVFLFDTSSLSTLYKFISFLTLGIILLLTGFLYNQYKDRIMEFIKA